LDPSLQTVATNHRFCLQLLRTGALCEVDLVMSEMHRGMVPDTFQVPPSLYTPF
jgi:hypothetical protein